MSNVSIKMSSYMIYANKGSSLNIKATVTCYNGIQPNYNITCSSSDTSIISIQNVVLQENKDNVHIIYFKVVGTGRCYINATSVLDPSVTISTLIIASPVSYTEKEYQAKTFVMPSTLEVERGQRFDIFARGLQKYSTSDSVHLVSYDGTSYFNFVPTSNQIELIDQGWDTIRTRGQFRAGNIPGTYTINVVPTEFAGDEYTGKTVTVNVVDKIYNEPFEQIYPSRYYVVFREVDNVGTSDDEAYVPNPAKLYFNKVNNGTPFSRFTAEEMEDIGWQILRDGIISKIERDGNNLKIYRGESYGVTQVIFYLKSNPHISYPVWVEYNGGPHQYYYNDGSQDATPIPSGESSAVHPVRVIISPSSMVLKKGAFSQVTASVEYSDGSIDNRVTYGQTGDGHVQVTTGVSGTSSNSIGLSFYGSKLGVTSLNVYSAVDHSIVASCIITVVEDPNSYVLVDSITLSPVHFHMNKGDTIRVTATVSPSNATNKEIRWSVPNQSGLITVTKDGFDAYVKAIRTGTTRLECYSQDGNAMAMTAIYIDSQTPDIPDNPDNPDIPDNPGGEDYPPYNPPNYASGTDVITYIKRDGDNYRIEKQYIGNLNFKTGGFFDSIVDYETENLSKVYWVDGVNQPRVITLQENWSEYDDTSFDFVPEIDKFPHVYIEKEHTSGAGIFKAGIVQYFFTYSNIHGVETAVVYSSPLFYADHRKRAGAPDDFVECQFNISISNLSQKFDKINVYRAIRTSVNTEVEMVKIANIDITGDTTSIIDDYVGGQAVSPTDLFFKGGDRFIAGTLAAKDNTLFLGNIDVDNPSYDELKQITYNAVLEGFRLNKIEKELSFIPSAAFLDGNREITYTKQYVNDVPHHSSNTYLKRGDYYNIGLQLQDKFGKWSEPILFDRFYSPQYFPNETGIPKQRIVLHGSSIPISIKDKYKRVRAVICYPNENKRNFIAQGVLNPSIYCLKDRAKHMPDAISSWFFRSIPASPEENVQTPTSTYLEYRHDYLLGSNDQLNCEVQFMDPYRLTDVESGGISSTWKWARVLPRREEAGENMKRTSNFVVDASICTLNSPDISDVGTDEEECNVNIVGSFNTSRVIGEYKINMQTAPNISVIGTGNITPENKVKSTGDIKHLTTWPLYFDGYIRGLSFGSQVVKQSDRSTGVGWAVYPWQADRPFGNDVAAKDGEVVTEENIFLNRDGSNQELSGQYSKKILGNIRYSETSVYSGVNNISDISDVFYYRGQQSGLTRLSFDNSICNYYSIVDSIYGGAYFGDGFLLRYANGKSEMEGGSQDGVSYAEFMNSNIRTLMNMNVWDAAQGGDIEAITLIAIEPTLIRYKSTPHAVFKIMPSFNSDTNKYKERVLPGYRDMTYAYLNSIWLDSSGVESAIPGMTERSDVSGVDTFWIGELNRSTDPEQMFPLDINDRAFVPSSDIYDITDSNIPIELYGDIHYKRWDCLKTYPYSYDDKNQVIDVLSFMVESKINLDGRYDRYVETEDVTAIDDSFFNKIDDVYNQKDNFFTYHIQEDWVKENKSFPNQFAWSQTKHPGEEIDTWTSVNLASTYQADGSLGEIRKIIKFGDSLFCFQDKGISQIMFNSNIQLSSSSGVPIELANSGKVDGVRYITNMEGCINPWTIKAGLVGIYFVDDINHSLDKLAADGIHRLSENKGFSDFVHRGHPFRTTWYDNEKKDVHFVTDNQTLCYSEKMDEFTSFYDYGRANIAFNVGDNWNQMYGEDNDLYTARRGNYFYFFDDNKPSEFSITYRIAPQPFNYKIFNTVDYLLRVNSVDGINHDLTYNSGFHEISVSTENGDVTHRIDKSDFTQNMNQIKKFNIWRTNIPRFDYFRRADGTSMYLCLRAGRGENGVVYDNNLSNKRYELHNLKISYLS